MRIDKIAGLTRFSQMKGKCLVIVLLFAACILSVKAQETPRVTTDVPAACEQNAAYIEEFNIKRHLNPEEMAFAVVRAGKGEQEKTLNHRYKIVLKYFKKFSKATPGSFTIVRGEPVDGQGRVELYFGGKLEVVMLAKKGRVPCMNCCGYDFAHGRF
jgi:hypothetical protein